MPASAGTELTSYQSTGLATTHTTAALSAGAAAGDLVVVAAVLDGWTANSVTDTSGNTYTRTVNFAQGGGTTAVLAWTVVTTPLTTSSTITVTPSGSASAAIDVQRFTGVAASPLDQSAAAGVAGGTAIGSGSTPTTAQADDLLVGVSALNPSTASVTPQVVSPVWSPTTTEDQVTIGASGKRRLNTYYRNVAATGAYAYNATAGATIVTTAAGIVAFKAAVAVLPFAFTPRRMPIGP